MQQFAQNNGIAPSEKLIKEFGPPIYPDFKGKMTKLNEPFWAAHYARSREKIIFEALEQEFYDYDSNSGIFTPRSSDLIRTDLSALIFENSLNWNGYQALEQFRNSVNLSGVIQHLRGQVEERDFFNHDANLVHLGNSTLRFSSDGSQWEPEPFSSEHRSRCRSPINYQEGADCPQFKQKILGHLSDNDRLVLQKYAGQCLLGRNISQRFLILDGVGGASKTAFVLVLAGIVGRKNVCELRPKLLDQRFEIGRMIGRTLLIGSDVRGDFINVEGGYRIKSLVGGDPLEAEIKRSNAQFKIYGIFNVIITSNSRLRIYQTHDQSAWARRTIVARYEKPYQGQRIFEIEKWLLEIESQGILNWCINGLGLLLSDHARCGDLALSDQQTKRVNDLLSESDSLRLFVENQIVRDDSKHDNGESRSLTTDEIIAEYIEDCVRVKHWTPVSYSTAEKKLPELMLMYFGTAKSNSINRNGKSQRGYWHVRFS
jgi:phage/plasmid-associated DNA primase